MPNATDNDFRSQLESAIGEFGLDPLSDRQLSQLVEHYTMLCRWNRSINLTRILKPSDAARLHYAESLYGATFINQHSVLDIGSGAGFPAVPIAIAKPEIHVTALEADHRKALFLKEAKDELALSGFSVLNARLEDFDWRPYELLTSRALERTEEMAPSLIKALGANQALMLFCTGKLAARLEAVAEAVEVHPIPHSDERVIAIFKALS